MKDNLQYNLCPGCGEIEENGIFWKMQHRCPLNTFVYRRSNFTLRKLNNILFGKDDLASFKELLYFKHFQAMPNFETSSLLDRKIYSICRESEIRTMKRLRTYIQLEEEFDYKY